MAKGAAMTLTGDDYTGIHGNIVALLERARRSAARSVNALMTAAYWEIGRCIVEFEQEGQERATYGKALLQRLSADLSARFGRGFGVVNLQQMRLFYQTWSLERIYQTVSDTSAHPGIYQTLSDNASGAEISPGFVAVPDLSKLARAFPLPWSAYVRLLSVKNEQARAKGTDEARYALEGLPNKIMAAEYQTVLPDEKLLAEELSKTRQVLEERQEPRRITTQQQFLVRAQSRLEERQEARRITTEKTGNPQG